MSEIIEQMSYSDAFHRKCPTCAKQMLVFRDHTADLFWLFCDSCLKRIPISITDAGTSVMIPRRVVKIGR